MSLVIFAIGNPSRGDDALGPLLMDELERQRPPGVHLVGDFQLQPEHALDLQERTLALFIDAGSGTPTPFEFSELTPAAGHAVSSHAFTPAEVLHVYEMLHGQPPPPAFLLCIRGDDFGLGDALSVGAGQNLEAARHHLRACLASPHAEAWRQRAQRSAAVTQR